MRNWLRSPTKSADWLWRSFRFRLGLVERVEVAPGISLDFDPRAYRVYREAQVQDPEQRDEFQNFIQHCRPGMRLFDIGAHFGIFSLITAKFGGSAMAVDPSPRAVNMIRRQSALNQLAKHVQTVQAAVSDATRTVKMVDAGVFSDGYFKLAASGRPSRELSSAQALTIDDLSQRFGPPTHIKIDVEGHEAAALRGAAGTLSAHSPLLFLELHTQMVVADGGDPRAALHELARLRYATHALTGEPISEDAILQHEIIRIVAKPNS